jgi:sodium pump decarboxylase gamma subunit
MSNVGQGLAISMMGMGITFAALAIFIGIMVVLQRLFPVEAKHVEETEQAEERETVNTLARDTSEQEIAVAISVALAHLYSQNNLGKSLEDGGGPWWTAGQFEQHALIKE